MLIRAVRFFGYSSHCIGNESQTSTSTSRVQTRSATRAQQITSIPSASVIDVISSTSPTLDETYPFVELPIEIVNDIVFKAVNAENWQKYTHIIRTLVPVDMQLSTYLRDLMRQARYNCLALCWVDLERKQLPRIH
jgi:hypothetical protein